MATHQQVLAVVVFLLAQLPVGFAVGFEVIHKFAIHSPFQYGDGKTQLSSQGLPQPRTRLVHSKCTFQQHFVNTSRGGDPQDSTPGIWGVNFSAETAGSTAPARVFKFPSDVKLAYDPFSSTEWMEFASGQAH
ncbi:hypothetical protein BDV96DRAFT_626459 [Lophiotrema nucula]|uniref:Uncharacterized protein n=1 Tax=Lophiotrema nucula TaxID=690887 RepID=A0A6A5ZUS7_9PLEO|nr:hypothetical protein BDV96DRAFT_626459 [Lophiotrema nucula]